KVKSANAAFYEEFQVTAAEAREGIAGRPWDIPELPRLLAEVISSNKKIEDFEFEQDFPSIGRKIPCLDARQIRQSRESEPLILLAIEDITERKRAEESRAAFR